MNMSIPVISGAIQNVSKKLGFDVRASYNMFTNSLKKEIYALNKEVFGPSFITQSKTLDNLQEIDGVLVITIRGAREGKLIGYAIGSKKPPFPPEEPEEKKAYYLHWLAIRKDQSNKEIGSALLRTIKKSAGMLGYTMIDTHCFDDDAQGGPLRRLYRKNGFQFVKHYSDIKESWMRCPI